MPRKGDQLIALMIRSANIVVLIFESLLKPPKTKMQKTKETKLSSKEQTPIASIIGLILGLGILDKAIGLY